MNKFSLSGKIALITGGGRGIGRAIVDALADAGADIAVAARKQAPLNEAVKAAEAKGRRAKAYSVDLRSVAALRKLVDDVVKDFGDLHILVNNAGVQLLAPAEDLSEEYWDETLATNLKAPFFLAQAAAKHFIKRGGGRKDRQHHLDMGRGRLPAVLCLLRRRGRLLLMTRALTSEWGQ